MTEEATNEGWVQLLDEMEAMSSEMEANGWKTLTVAAGDAAPVMPDEQFTDRHGYVYVIPGDAASTFEEWFVPDGFPRTEVYRAVSGGNLHLLTVFVDPATEAAILLAGVLDVGALGECQRIARQKGVMYSHLCKVDGTHLGSFEHHDPEPFFPQW